MTRAPFARHLVLVFAGLTLAAPALGLTSDSAPADNVIVYPFLMPDVTPNRDELYLCSPIKVDPLKAYYIVAFEPNATMHTAHHMLLYGCSKPGSDKPVWNCGEMQKSESSNDFSTTASPCGEGSQIIYAWARDAPKLTLPEGVGFRVGGDSPIQYLVLQVHYMHKFPAGTTDNSGVFLHYTENKLSKLAGVLLLGTGGGIPPNAIEHMETSCTIKENKVIHPFAYRTHTHSLGKVVSGYRIRFNDKGDDNWTLLGKRDPLTPQMFYPVDDSTPITTGDKLAARCTMQSDRDTYTKIGATNNDEMCNFYLMYWVENSQPLEQKYCFSAGPPTYYWKQAEPGLRHIPDIEASTL